MNRVCRWLTRLVLASLLLAGCGTLPGTRTTPETTPADPTPTRNTPANATPSGVAKPTRELWLSEPHAWDAESVLVQLYTSPGFVPDDYAWSTMPDLVVYADGTVVVVRESYRDEISRRSVELARVDPGELCALLGQIESYGFFDFDQADYQEPQVTDMGTTQIDVNA